MKKTHLNAVRFGFAAIAALAMMGCQDMDHPEVGSYPVDENPPGGPLKFYVPFDMNSSDPLMYAVDQVRAKFPTENNFEATSGISGGGVMGESDKMINYAKPNDWALTMDSFTVAFWEKHNGQTMNGANPGAEHIFSVPSSNGHWSGATMFLLFDQYGGSATAAAIKFVVVDADMTDNWFTWENAESIEGVLDNQWHHFAFTYDSASSTMTMYIDGAVAGTKVWGTHGSVTLDDSKITGFRIGNGPQTQNGTGDNWLYSNWKGSLDQFRLYNIALTQAEVQELYSTNK